MCDLKQGMEQLGTWLVWVVLMDCCDELSYFTVWTFVFGVLIVANLTDGHGGFVYGEVEMFGGGREEPQPLNFMSHRATRLLFLYQLHLTQYTPIQCLSRVSPYLPQALAISVTHAHVNRPPNIASSQHMHPSATPPELSELQTSPLPKPTTAKRTLLSCSYLSLNYRCI
jgi:hypothetical protein